MFHPHLPPSYDSLKFPKLECEQEFVTELLTPPPKGTVTRSTHNCAISNASRMDLVFQCRE